MSFAEDRSQRGRLAAWRSGALALLIVLVLCAWSWPLALSSTSLVAFPRALFEASSQAAASGPASSSGFALFTANDQLLTIFGVAHNARSILSGNPAALIDHGLCWPTPDAAFLGEHMIESGILGLPAYAFTRDPIVTYNVACLFSVLFATLSMFWLIRRWTGSNGGALVAALLFGLAPKRLDNLAHLAVEGTHWIPLVLLLFERLLDTGRVRDAAALALVAGLACLTGSYPTMTLALFGGSFALARLAGRRADLDLRRLLLLAAAVLVVAGLQSVVLSPYLRGEETWKLFRWRSSTLASYGSLLPGGSAGLGISALLLAIVALLFRDPSDRDWERKRRLAGFSSRVRQPQSAPRAAILFATLVCLAVCAEGRLWPGGPSLPSLYRVAADYFPALGFVRVPAALRSGVVLGLALLAGIGWARVLTVLGGRGAESRSARRGRTAITMLVTAAVLAELFWPPLSKVSFGRDRTVHLRSIAPAAETLAAYAPLDGPILDLPYHDDARHGIAEEMPLYVLNAAYHGKPVAACYNSYKPPTQQNAARFAERIHAALGRAKPEAALRPILGELLAAGFRGIVVHRDLSGSDQVAGLLRLAGPATAAADDGSPRLELLSLAEKAAALRVAGRVATHHDRRSLQVGGLELPTRAKLGPQPVFAALEVSNTATGTWALEHPVRPLAAFLRFTDEKTGRVGPWLERRVMLPLALAPGATDEVVVPLTPLPPPGLYFVDLEIPDLGWTVQAMPAVEVR